MTETWYTRRELARILRTSPKSIQRYVKPTYRIGRQNRYLMSDVRAQLANRDDLPENVVALRPEIERVA